MALLKTSDHHYHMLQTFRHRPKTYLFQKSYHISAVTLEQRSFGYLMQRLSVAIQRGNAVCVIGTVPSSTNLDELFL